MATVPRKKKQHYVNNRTLFEKMQEYKAARLLAESENRPPPKIPRYIGECLLMICTKLATKPNFSGYTYRDEMVADGIENCIAAVDNFDPDRYNNPFAYFTQIAWNAFIRRINREKKQSYIKHKNYQNNYLMSDQQLESITTNEYSDDLIKSFEDKMVVKKPASTKRSGVELFANGEIKSENSVNN
jgi:Sigma-70 region 2